MVNGVQAADLNPYSASRAINWDGTLPPRSSCLTRPNVQLTAGLLTYAPSMDYTTGVTEQQLMAMLQQVGLQLFVCVVVFHTLRCVHTT